MKINISKRIDNCGLTKQAIMEYLGISRSTFYGLYNGDATSIQFNVLEKLCELFDCTPDDLFDKYQNKKTKSIPSTKEIETFKANAHVSFGDLLADIIDDRIKTIAKQELNEGKDDTK